MSFVVAHPGTQHSFQTAAALSRAGMLDKYCTSLFFSEKQIAGVAKLLPSPRSKAVSQSLKKRSCTELPPGQVVSWPLDEILYKFASRYLSPQKASTFLERRNRKFQKLAANYLKQSGASGVVAYDTSASLLFRQIRDKATLKVLEQTIAHPAALQTELLQLQEAFPEWAALETVSSAEIDRNDLETAEADLVVCGSSYVKETLQARGEISEKLKVLPYGVNTSLFFPPKSSTKAPAVKGGSRYSLLFAGAVSARKGLPYLLEAMKLLNRSDCTMRIAGSLCAPDSLLRSCHPSVEFLGHLSQERLSQEMRAADIFIYPSLHEGSAIAIYQALSCGLPVVCTRQSGSIVEDERSGLIVEAHSSAALAEAVDRLLSSPEQRESMAQRAAVIGAAHTWSRFGSKICEQLAGLEA